MSELANKYPDLFDYVIYRCIVGSRAFGLDDEDSDTDRRGIYLPPAQLHWSLYELPGQIENEANQESYFEIKKFLLLALKANPNVLESLYTPLVEKADETAGLLLAHKEKFLSKLVHQTYNGYALSQFRKIEQDTRSKGSPRWKHVMHMMRLLISGITILKEGYVPIDTGPNKAFLLEIKAGKLSWEKIEQRRLELHHDLEKAYAQCKLPDRPDYDFANELLISARRKQAGL